MQFLLFFIFLFSTTTWGSERPSTTGGAQRGECPLLLKKLIGFFTLEDQTRSMDVSFPNGLQIDLPLQAKFPGGVVLTSTDREGNIMPGSRVDTWSLGRNKKGSTVQTVAITSNRKTLERITIKKNRSRVVVSKLVESLTLSNEAKTLTVEKKLQPGNNILSSYRKARYERWVEQPLLKPGKYGIYVTNEAREEVLAATVNFISINPKEIGDDGIVSAYKIKIISFSQEQDIEVAMVKEWLTDAGYSLVAIRKYAGLRDFGWYSLNKGSAAEYMRFSVNEDGGITLTSHLFDQSSGVVWRLKPID